MDNYFHNKLKGNLDLEIKIGEEYLLIIRIVLVLIG